MSEPEAISLANLLRAYRGRLGITQEQLAERWGMSVHTVRGIEAGRRTTHHEALVDLLTHE